jgi:hypothetical protein
VSFHLILQGTARQLITLWNSSIVNIFASEIPNPLLHDHNKSSRPVYYHSSLNGVFTPKEIKKKRSSILNGDAHAAKPDIDEDFGSEAESAGKTCQSYVFEMSKNSAGVRQVNMMATLNSIR